MIQGHIKKMLYAYDCVIIPDFGGLITHYAPAKIHPVKHTFTPPSKRIAFNEQLKVNDGLLISTLANQQQWPLTQAQQAVADFVQDLKEQLLVQHRFELQDVGVFRYNAERKLVFENIENENFLDASFGLPELVSKPIIGKDALVLRGKYKDQMAAQAKGSGKSVGRAQRFFRIGASLVVAGLTVSAAYLFSLQHDVALSSLNPIGLFLSQSNQTPAPAANPEVSSKTNASVTTAWPLENSWEKGTASLNELVKPTDSVWSSFPKNRPETTIQSSEALVGADSAVMKPAPVVSVTESPADNAKVVAPVKEETKAAVETGTIKKRTGRFYVIMGVFTQNGYAKRNQNQLKKKGYEAKVLQPNYDLKRERVSVADFATAREAHAALPALRTKINNELWVFNY